MVDTEGDEEDDVKGKCRNLSEKKRRDQFNLLINELATMVSANNRKMDKSTVLKATIAFFKNQKETLKKCEGDEVREDWQPSFLSNEEFTHLMLEALDGFIMTLSRSGRILYTSESITPLLGHLPSEVTGSFLSDLMPAEEQNEVKRFLSNPALAPGMEACPEEYRERYTIAIHIQRGGMTPTAVPVYERIHLTGYFERYKCPSEDGVLDFSCSEAEDSSMSVGGTSRSSNPSPFTHSQHHSPEPTKIVFVAIARLEHPQLLRELIVLEPTKSEFTSRHSLEWKFLFLDHRAPTIIGYLPFEVLGTSGYDYYHVDDLEKVSECHEMLMKKGKGISCFYRFLTKGQQWIWLRSHYCITYHQWNSKPEFIVCTNTVVSYGNIKGNNQQNHSEREEKSDMEFESHSQPTSEGGGSFAPSSNEAASSTRGDETAGGLSMLTHQQQQQQTFLQQKSYRSTQQQMRVSIENSSSSCTSQPSHPPPQGTAGEGVDPLFQPQQMPLTKRQFQLQKLEAERDKLQQQQQQQQQQQYGSELQDQSASPASYNAMETSMMGGGAQASMNPSSMTQPTQGLRQSLFMTYEQQQLQDQLQKKHSELQRHILLQQEELRKVNQQLFMAQYGVNLQLIKGGGVPNHQQQQQQQYATQDENASPSSLYHASDGSNMGVVSGLSTRGMAPNLGSLHHVTGMPVNTSPMGYDQYVTTSSALGVQAQLPITHSVVAPSVQAIGFPSVAVPYELSQHQAQMLFSHQRQQPAANFQPQQPQHPQPQQQQQSQQ
uniref:Clock 1-4 n=1 Tax=Eurydice pulchra TaxID=155694 RepID=T2C9E5_EURPU|nr:clock 1-4 [Eurydice pulchra]